MPALRLLTVRSTVATLGCAVETIVATIWQKSMPAWYGVSGASGMKMCSPSDPEVLGKPGTPTFSRTSWTHRATSRIWSKVAPGCGSRSMATWSGVCRASSVEKNGSIEIDASCAM